MVIIERGHDPVPCILFKAPEGVLVCRIDDDDHKGYAVKPQEQADITPFLKEMDGENIKGDYEPEPGYHELQ